jgi:hypothetical protein
VDDLDSAVSSAIALGAREAEHQPAPDKWRVLIDPVGHLFCLSTGRPDRRSSCSEGSVDPGRIPDV